eukprot:GHVP01025582.1.p1 GENE.GHVP01025582.1~~GHVP01025582.1.p1  ORF type:complete len:563 (+),score=91.25 GHVP01025582.1:63-1751(+)
MSASSPQKPLIGDVVCAGDRIENATFGLVRYLGPLEGDPNVDQVWIGVEWWSKDYGKGDGSFRRSQYFCVKDGHSASFLKQKKISPSLFGISFEEAIQEKYCKSKVDVEKINELSFFSEHANSQQKVEFLGFQKIEALMQDLTNLHTVTFVESPIRYAGDGVSKLCLLRLKSLKIENCMITKFEEFLKICQDLPALTSASLNGNCLRGDSMNKEDFDGSKRPKYVIQLLKELHLNKTGISKKFIKHMDYFFPNLHHLTISGNPLLREILPDDFCDNNRECWRSAPFANLSTLEVCNCEISSWAVMNILDQLPRLHTFLLSGNYLPGILDVELTTNLRIKELVLSDNKIDNYDILAKLSQAFSELKVFRWQGNHLYNIQGTRHKDVTPLVIGLFPNLTNLNGTTIMDADRLDAEKFVAQIFRTKSQNKYFNDQTVFLSVIEKIKNRRSDLFVNPEEGTEEVHKAQKISQRSIDIFAVFEDGVAPYVKKKLSIRMNGFDLKALLARIFRLHTPSVLKIDICPLSEQEATALANKDTQLKERANRVKLMQMVQSHRKVLLLPLLH